MMMISNVPHRQQYEGVMGEGGGGWVEGEAGGCFDKTMYLTNKEA